MPDISHHIPSYLCLSDAVIIPGFGKLLKVYRAAELNPFEKKLSPPSYVLQFDFSIQEDESESFVRYVANAEKISFEEAAEAVYLYKKDLLARIFAEGTAEIPEVGIFKAINNKVQLEDFPKSIINSFADFEILDAIPVKREKLETVEAVTPKKKISIPFIIALISIPVLLVLLFTVDFNPKGSGKQQDKAEIPTAEKMQDRDTTAAQPTDTLANAAEDTTVQKQETAPKPGLKEYQIVVGTFSGEENAKKTIQKLKAAGYETRLKKLSNGKVRAAVSVRVYNEAELDVQLKKVRKKFEKGAFVAE